MSIQHEPLSSFTIRVAPPTMQTTLSRRAQWRIYRLALITSDSAMIVLAFSLAYWLRFHLRLSVAPDVIPSPIYYATLTIVLIPIWLGLFALFRLYDLQLLLSGTAEYARAFNACTIGMMLVIIITFVDPTFVVARGWVISAWLLSILSICSARFWLRRFVYFLRQRGYFLAPAAIVGTNQEALALAEQLQAWRQSGLYVVGFISTDEEPTSRSLLGVPVLGSVSDLATIANNQEIEEFIVAATAVNRNTLLNLFEQVSALNDVELRLSSGLFEVLTTGVQVKTLGSVPLMSLNKLRLDPIENILKTILDYTLSVTALVLLSPILLTVAALIKFDSPGPIFHRRRVLGVGRKEFDAFKFRTMYVNGNEILAQDEALVQELETTGKLKEDPRITRLGRHLRRYSLDEWPQLFNVLLGQMSLVGPRMISSEEAKQYGRLRTNLLTVKPGMTGLWQVSGRSDLTYEERVRLDMHYIRTYTIWQDLHILFIQTPPAVLKARGAY